MNSAAASLRTLCVTVLVFIGSLLQTAYAQMDSLPSWNDGAGKTAILQFVRATTDKASPNCSSTLRPATARGL